MDILNYAFKNTNISYIGIISYNIVRIVVVI
jgi:hypothetical protein